MTTKQLPTKFVSAGNRKEDLQKMQAQLVGLQAMVNNLAAPKEALYPSLDAPPADFAGDVADVIRAISTMMEQIMTSIVKVKDAAAPIVEHASSAIAAPASPVMTKPEAAAPPSPVSQIIKPIAARIRPIPASAIRKPVLAIESPKTPRTSRSVSPVDSPTPIPALDAYVVKPEDIEVAHSALDAAINSLHVNPRDLVLTSYDELFCVKRFRKIISDSAGQASKKFIEGLDKMTSSGKK